MPALFDEYLRVRYLQCNKFRRYALFTLCFFLLVMSIVLTACSLSGNAGPAASTPTSSLAQLHWCGKPSLLFRDEGASATGTATSGSMSSAATTATPTTISSWSQFKGLLNFTLYLPAALPQGTCLSSAFGTVHDPVFGSSFTIGFMLPNHDPITLSEAPLRSQDPKFQCSVTTSGVTTGSTPSAMATKTGQASMQLCTGARGTTNIVFSARGSTGDLESFFQHLQSNVNWVPAA